MTVERLPRVVAVPCVHGVALDREHFVQCALGLYGGVPHRAICRKCKSYSATSFEANDRDPGRLSLAQRSPDDVDSQPAPTNSHQKKERLLLRSFLSPGDILMLTATIRDLHYSYPNRFETAVETSCPEIWENNPYVTVRTQDDQPWRSIEMHYPLVNESNQRPVHFLAGYSQYLESQLKLPIPVTQFAGDIHLSEQEKGWMNQVNEMWGYKGRFWILMAGGKYDYTTKWWSPDYYQAVVDHFQGRVQFVQCGERGHWHPELKGVFNLVGRTTIRQFIRLVHHAQGVISPVTFAMHLAAAVPRLEKRLRPCVVVAGGREAPHWEAYPGHQFLHTIGYLPCCATGGCWKSRCQPVGDGDEKDRAGLCERPVLARPGLKIPQCMMMIRPEDVIRAVDRYLQGT